MAITRASLWWVTGRYKLNSPTKKRSIFQSIRTNQDSNYSKSFVVTFIRYHCSLFHRFNCLASTPSFCKGFTAIIPNISSSAPSASKKYSLQPSKFHSSSPCHENIVDLEDSSKSNLLAQASVSEALADGGLLEREVDSDIDELLSHLRIKLYSTESDSSGQIAKLYEAASIQEILDIIDNSPIVDARTSSQALVSLWDLQKLLFQLNSEFKPNDDIMNRSTFIKSIRDNPIFQEKILKPVLDQLKELDDEPLCACLLSMKKMNFSLTEYQPLIEECIQRKDTLDLAGLSRLSVCLRSENLYGNCIMGEFSPLILKYVKSADDDNSIRLVSILLRSANRIVSEEIALSYLENVQRLLTSGKKLEIVTYSKIFLVLLECDSTLQSHDIMTKVGRILASKVPEMDLMELLSLQKFLINPLQEPYPLVEALLERNLRVIEENKDLPRLDLISSVAPYMKDSKQKMRLLQFANNYMKTNSDFSSAQNVLFSILRCVKSNDKMLNDLYWNNILTTIDGDTSNQNLRKVLFCARNYINFCHGHMLSYRHLWFESIVKKTLYSYLDNYIKQRSTNVVLNPSEFSVLISFLLAFDTLFFDVKYLRKLEHFAPQFKASDLYFISKGIDCTLMDTERNKKRNQGRGSRYLNDVCSILEEECGHRLIKNMQNIHHSELTMICRLIGIVRKFKGDSPLMDMSMKAFLENPIKNSREVREICNVLLSGNFNLPTALDAMFDFLLNHLETISPETVEKFLILSYSIGWETGNGGLERLADVIEKNWNKVGLGIINLSVALGFHRQLSPGLINKIFTVDFLDYIDEELATTSFGKNQQYPMRLRMSLMDLNRVACLDVPSVGLPWFHDKFCESIIAKGRPKPSYLHLEVQHVLNQIFGGDEAVQTNVCSAKDYYYSIDFLLEFDENDIPIRRRSKSKTFSFANFSKPEESKIAKRKVAIIILNDSVFTKHIRNVKGGMKLKERHLEILGYQVIKIDPFHWNSMYMSEHSVKEQFLESRIFNLPSMHS